MTISTSKYSVIQERALNNKDIEITANGTYTAGTGYSGFNVVRVNVPEPQYTALTINPSISSQTFEVEDIYHGYSPITVNPVTSSIDNNIIPENIKKGVTILGVTGNIEFITEEIEITPTKRKQTKTPTTDGFSKVVIKAVTSDVDGNILPENILSGIEILGVAGTAIESKETTRTITHNGVYEPPTGYTGFSSVDVNIEIQTTPLNVIPTTTTQTFEASDIYHAYNPITVQAVTSDVDSNITESNIKKGITILGVTGSCIELNPQVREVELKDKTGTTYTPTGDYNGIKKITVTPKNCDQTVNATTSTQTIEIPDNYAGNGVITVNPVTHEIDSNITASNIRKNVSILGVTGNLEELKGQTKRITSNGTFTPGTGYNGFTSVEVAVDTVRNQDITITTNGVYNPDEGYTGFGTVTVDINTVNNTDITISPSTSSQEFTPPSPYTGFETVTVNPVTSAIDPNIKAENIVKDVTILGITGNYQVPLQTKTLVVDANTETTFTITPDEGYDGISSLSVDLSWIEEHLQELNAGDVDTTPILQDKTVSVDGTEQIITVNADSGYDGLGTVTVDCSSLNDYIEDLKGQAIDTNLEKVLNGSGRALATDVSTLRSYACYYYSDLEKAVLNNALVIGDYAFAHSNISNLTIRTNSVCTLGANALDNTPIANGTGTIYVPSTLVDEYKADADWSVYSSRIQAIS